MAKQRRSRIEKKPAETSPGHCWPAGKLQVGRPSRGPVPPVPPVEPGDEDDEEPPFDERKP